MFKQGIGTDLGVAMAGGMKGVAVLSFRNPTLCKFQWEHEAELP